MYVATFFESHDMYQLIYNKELTNESRKRLLNIQKRCDEDNYFKNGVSIYLIETTRGLEFDGWDTYEDSKRNNYQEYHIGNTKRKLLNL